MLQFMLKLYARLPLPVIHGMGVVAGWLMFFGSRRFAYWARLNLKASGITDNDLAYARLLRRNIAETGKGTLETIAIWFRPETKVLDWVKECRGWEHIEAALQKGRGILFLTPHLGCFEITSLYYAAHHPVTILYRPPRKAWLEPMINAGRARGKVKLAPTNVQGVRALLKALKQKEAIGILPDQVPAGGEGAWASFFGRPAYTMTLVGRLAEATDPVVLMAFGERLSWGRGFIVHFMPFEGKPDAATINAAIEQLVRTKPEQYMWSYQRYKIPTGVEPPAE
jgi:KDO2-lipid IV(A) lauroyltransferase